MRKLLGLIGASMVAFSGYAMAQPSNVPAPGGALLDLAGQPLPGPTFTQYSVNFDPLGVLTAITFVMRADPMYLYLDNVSLVDNTTSSGNLMVNGSFEADAAGTVSPTGWTYNNPFAATFTGAVGTNPTGVSFAEDGSNFYGDGSVQAYDDITQNVATNIGDSYTLSFWVATDSTLTSDASADQVVSNFQQLSTNGNVTDIGGNAVDVLAYASYPAPTLLTTAPEPASLAVISVGLLGLRTVRRRRKVA